MKIPYLKKGDVIDIIAPASRCEEITLNKTTELLSSWGLHSRIAENIFGDDLLCANTDEKRFQQLQEALTNDVSSAVWCLRGGYGSARLMPALAKIKAPSQQKLFIGFSDITVIHLFLQKCWGWSTLHGPSLRQVVFNTIAEDSIQNLKKILFQEVDSLCLKNLKPFNQLAKKQATIQSVITGGNLSIIQTSIGTPWQIDAREKIILIEDVNERGYRIDRILTHFLQANILQEAKALLIGDFTKGEENDGLPYVERVLQQFSEKISIPVLRIEDVGHGKGNQPIILNQAVTLKTGVSCSLTFAVK